MRASGSTAPTIWFTNPTVHSTSPIRLSDCPKRLTTDERSFPIAGFFESRQTASRPQLLTTDLSGPNGLAFSPDEKYFYVDNWDERKKVVMRYEVNADGTLCNG